MKNLQEVYQTLQEIQEDPDEESIIKPIKITSPTNIEMHHSISFQRMYDEDQNDVSRSTHFYQVEVDK